MGQFAAFSFFGVAFLLRVVPASGRPFVFSHESGNRLEVLKSFWHSCSLKRMSIRVTRVPGCTRARILCGSHFPVCVASCCRLSVAVSRRSSLPLLLPGGRQQIECNFDRRKCKQSVSIDSICANCAVVVCGK